MSNEMRAMVARIMFPTVRGVRRRRRKGPRAVGSTRHTHREM